MTGSQSIPTVVAFKNGQPVDVFMGAIPESQVRAFVNKLKGDGSADEGPSVAELLAAAEDAIRRWRLPRRRRNLFRRA